MDLTYPLGLKSDGLLTPKEEPKDFIFIKTENAEEDQFVVPGIVSLQMANNENFIKKEPVQADDLSQATPSSLNVSWYLFSICYLFRGSQEKTFSSWPMLWPHRIIILGNIKFI